MMKDKELIDKVVQEHKIRVSQVFSKFYRLLKSLHRQLSTVESNQGSNFDNENPKKGFIDLIIALCRDSFNLLGEGKKELTIAETNKLCELLGKKLTKDEFYFFIKKCVSASSNRSNNLNLTQKSLNIEDLDDSLNEAEEDTPGPVLYKGGDSPSHNQEQEEVLIDFFKIMTALEEYAEEKSWNPVIVSSSVFSAILKSSNPISIYELKKYMGKFNVLDEKELSLLLNEMKYLQSIKATISIDDISMLTRDNVMGYAK